MPIVRLLNLNLGLLQTRIGHGHDGCNRPASRQILHLLLELSIHIFHAFVEAPELLVYSLLLHCGLLSRLTVQRHKGLALIEANLIAELMRVLAARRQETEACHLSANKEGAASPFFSASHCVRQLELFG